MCLKRADTFTSRLPPTRANRGGSGLSFSFLICLRDCLRPARGSDSYQKSVQSITVCLFIISTARTARTIAIHIKGSVCSLSTSIGVCAHACFPHLLASHQSPHPPPQIPQSIRTGCLRYQHATLKPQTAGSATHLHIHVQQPACSHFIWGLASSSGNTAPWTQSYLIAKHGKLK